MNLGESGVFLLFWSGFGGAGHLPSVSKYSEGDRVWKCQWVRLTIHKDDPKGSCLWPAQM